MKKLLLFLLLSSAAWAHPLSDKARAIEEMARLLEQRMTVGSEPLTWGQQMALEDMKALAQAAGQARVALEPDLELEQVRTQLGALQLAANRVRLSGCVARLDDEGMKLCTALVGQIKEVEEALILECGRLQDRQLAARRPVMGFSLGFGYPAWNYGWPYYRGGWGRVYTRRCR